MYLFPVLREDSVLIIDRSVKLYGRERSRKWQAAFQVGCPYINIYYDVENDIRNTNEDPWHVLIMALRVNQNKW